MPAPGGQAIERREALRDDVLGRREHVVGERLPVRKEERRCLLTREETELRVQLLGAARARRDGEDETLRFACGCDERQRSGAAVELAPTLVADCAGRRWRQGACMRARQSIMEQRRVRPQASGRFTTE